MESLYQGYKQPNKGSNYKYHGQSYNNNQYLNYYGKPNLKYSLI